MFGSKVSEGEFRLKDIEQNRCAMACQGYA